MAIRGYLFAAVALVATVVGIIGLTASKPSGPAPSAKGVDAASVQTRSTPGCAASAEHAAGSSRDQPLLAVVGASFSAGVGAPPGQGWPQQLARILGWRVEVGADPGAGYVNPGHGDGGPMLRLAGRLGLAHHPPAVLIIQSGHNDIGTPVPMLRAAVDRLVRYVERTLPGTRIAIVTVFATAGRPSAAAWSADHTIVSAAEAADPQVLVFDPLASHWVFPRIADDLHPTVSGHRWIADQLASGLRHRYDLVGGCTPIAR